MRLFINPTPLQLFLPQKWKLIHCSQWFLEIVATRINAVHILYWVYWFKCDMWFVKASRVLDCIDFMQWSYPRQIRSKHKCLSGFCCCKFIEQTFFLRPSKSKAEIVYTMCVLISSIVYLYICLHWIYMLR